MAQKTRYFVVTDNDKQLCLLKASYLTPVFNKNHLIAALKEKYKVKNIVVTLDRYYKHLDATVVIATLNDSEFLNLLLREIFLYS